jgi:all-trans-retinol 13,14-reductase
VNDVIDSIITNPLLRQVLASRLPLYAGVKDHTPFYVHALITDSYNQSASRIVGGSSVVADALADIIRSMGGRVLLKHRAEQIECDDYQATAVITQDGERFEADLVVSAIHPANTIQMVNSRLIRPAYRRRLADIHQTTGAFTVYLKFRKDSVKYMDSNYYLYRGDSVWGCEDYDDTTWPKFLLYMHVCHEENPEYARAGEILTYMNMDELQQWSDTHVGRRGEQYEEFKRQKAETAIEALEQEMPGLRDNIETYYTSTPLTYLDYTGIPEGSMYGIQKDVASLGNNVSCKTSIPNLFLTGQSIILHGMLGVISGSFVTCSEILSPDVIFSQLEESRISS